MTITVIRNGTEYALNDGTYCWARGDDGWGAAHLFRLATSGPQQHGDTDEGFRLNPRIASLILSVNGSSWANMLTRRATLLDIFSPLDSLIIRWDGIDKQIDGYFAGSMDMSSRDRAGFVQNIAVTLKCPDPSFYNPTIKLITFGASGGASVFSVPMPVPHGVGAAAIDESVGINYAGNWYSYPTIRITGPITDTIITNVTTNEKLDFDGVTIAAGDYYEIDTRYGYKTVLDDSDVNKIADLTEDSDLATFHLQPDSADAPGGSNSIEVTGTSVSTATKVELWYYDRYTGI